MYTKKNDSLYDDILDIWDDATGRGSSQNSQILPEGALDYLFENSGLIRKICMTIPWMAIKDGFNIIGDDSDFISNLHNTKTITEIEKHYAWDNLYGGSLLFMGVNDGKAPIEPIDWNGIQNLMYVKTYSRHQIHITTSLIDTNPMNPTYMKPEFYTIQPSYGSNIKVHHSRCIVSTGPITPESTVTTNSLTWGNSAIQPVYMAWKRLTEIYINTGDVVKSFVLNVVKMEQLIQKIQSGQSGEIKERLTLMLQHMKEGNLLLVGDGEDVIRSSTSASGLDKLIQEQALSLCAEADFPMSYLFGRSPTGISSTSEKDETYMMDKAKWFQKNKLTYLLNRLNNVIVKSKDYSEVSSVNPYAIVYNEMKPINANDLAEIQTKTSQSDERYYNMGVLATEDIKKRFEGGAFNQNIELGDTSNKDIAYSPEDEEETPKEDPEQPENDSSGTYEKSVDPEFVA